MTKAVIFDHDGILVDSEPLHKLAWKRTFAPKGVEVTEAELNANIGRTDKIFTELIIEKHRLALSVADILSEKCRHMRELMRNESKTFDGVSELLEQLVERGMRLGIASSAKRDEIQVTLDRFGFERYFSAIVSFEDVQDHKPDPEPYSLCCQRLGFSPAEAVALEDSPSGITSARRAGVYTIGVATSLPIETVSAADVTINDFTDTARVIGLIERHGRK